MITLVDHKGFCFCHCGDKCPLGKCGSAFRCTKEQLEKEGHKVVQLSKRSSKEVHKFCVIEDKDKSLKIRCIKI